MKEIYQKSASYSFIGGVMTTVFSFIFYFLWYEGFSSNGDILIISITSAVVLFGSGLYFRNVHEKLQNTTSPVSSVNIDEINELNLQKVPSLLPKVYHVNSNGSPLFQIKPAKGKFTSKLTFFEVFEKGLIFSITYDVVDMDGNKIASFVIRNKVKQFELTLTLPDGTKVGYFIQDFIKSAVKNKGILYNTDGTVWQTLESSSMAGDIDVIDDEGKITARYRYGLFPYAMHPAFQNSVHNEHIRFGPHISVNEKLAYIMIFFFWFNG